ncbi:MAG: DMT family transporter [Burkholderiaceae bacterium]|nr:DMT family transporter [Burkholderiaceae bacterium]
MNQKLTPATILLLIVPPLLWAGNAVVGRLLSEMIPPITLNFLRWTIALLILLPLGRSIFRPGSGLLRYWRRSATLGLLGIGLYNTLQYMALHTSTPLNVTLVAASMPVWMLVTGRMFFNSPIKGYQMLGGIVSIIGVLVVLSHGDWHQLLELRLVIGDVFMLIATAVWSFYSWMLTQEGDGPEIRRTWATFLLAQVVYGVVWSSVFATSEWALIDAHIQWGWPLILGLLYVAVGPAIVAFRCWSAGVQRVGPAIAGFFNNLTPLFAALMSLAFLGESPQLYHAAAFACIVGGIILSARQTQP